MRDTAVQVNWNPPRPLSDYEREVVARAMRRAADALLRQWEADARSEGEE